MPVVQPGSKILVTGGNGYIGVSAIGLLLERGYAVRATARWEVDWLGELFEDRYKDKFEAVVVEDITKVCSRGWLSYDLDGAYCCDNFFF